MHNLKFLMAAVFFLLAGCASTSGEDGHAQQFSYNSSETLVTTTHCLADKLRVHKLVNDLKQQQMDVNVYLLTVTLVNRPNTVAFHVSPRGSGAGIDVTVTPPMTDIKNLLLEDTAGRC